MRIRQLELNGFKSFPHRTVLDVPNGVTAVVGPNGCGKSNIVDAIRWVLGEQSAKHLRGDAMEAVVFNGNERLAPLGMAEVSLTFDNDGSARPPTEFDLETSTLPAHFRGLSEIRVSRRYYRSGESEYFINKIPCRLKDITELFLGTGIGAKAYAVIEQGQVERLINAKPEERRLFIEEAAGTTLYRSRKLAAERKMERTRENLARVNDVLAEIDRQAQYLQRQAKRAEEYRRLQQEIRTLDLRLAAQQWRRLEAERQSLDAAWQEAADGEARLRQALSESETAHQRAAEALASAEREQSERREALAVLDAERERVRERVQMLEQELAERERRAGRLGAEAEQLAAAGERLARATHDAAEERAQLAAQLAHDEATTAHHERELTERRAAVATAQAHVETIKAALVEQLTRQVEVRNALATHERRRDDAARRLAKLRAELHDVRARLAAIREAQAAKRDAMAQVRAQLATATGAQAHRTDELRALAESRRRWEREIATAEGALVQAQSRLQSLEQIQDNYEGFQRGVRAILRERAGAEGVLGVVADVIDIPEPYERAVAAVLGDRLQYVIVRGADEAADAVRQLRREESGRGSFIPLEPRRNGAHSATSLNGSSRALLEVIGVQQSFRPVVEALLGDVALVPDLPAAIEIWRQNGIRVTLVTPDGDVIDPSGVITGGSDRPLEEGFLARRREIEQLRGSAVESEARVAIGRQEFERIGQRMARIEEDLHALGEGVRDLGLQVVAVEKDMERFELEQAQGLSRERAVAYEIAQLAEEDRASEGEVQAATDSLRALADEQRRREGELQNARAVCDGALAEAEAVAAALTAAKVRCAEQRERVQAAQAGVEALRQQAIELERRAEATRSEIVESERERRGLAENLAAARALGEEQAGRRQELVAALEGATAAVAEAGRVRQQHDERTREIQGALEATRTERGRLEVARSEVRVHAEHLLETMRERYGLDLREGVEPPTEAPAEGAESERLEALRARLARLGDVNVGAIDELRELEERSSFLRTQRDDLERSLADLERTIQRLNRVTRARFAEAFARANETFQKVFPRLFRGGEARLVLTDEQNLLESGVEIVVRPPGKRLDTVALLSGGEKALVAVSLIFSLFLINPTPFCILDEVDAPLDDANIGRFTQMIHEMRDRLQFVIITHNKRTMEAADALYGITMQEPGVSKVISVAMK
jgi:chromosome segregation protein